MFAQVVSQVCEYLQIPSLHTMRIYHRDLPAISNLQRAIKEVNMFIEVGQTEYTCHFLIFS